MFFFNYRKVNVLQRSSGISLYGLKKEETRTVQEEVEKEVPLIDEETGEPLVDEETGETLMDTVTETIDKEVTELVGSFTDDATHKNIYIGALDTLEVGEGIYEVQLIETPKASGHEYLYLEANPAALALGLIHSQVILKRGEEFKLYLKGDPKNLLLLDWVIKLSIIRGERN